MPHMDGVGFLQPAREIYPDAKRALLTAYADTNAAISAINQANIDYFFMKPWDPPRSISIRSSTICWMTGRRPIVLHFRESACWERGGRRDATSCAIFWRGVTFHISGSMLKGRRMIRKRSVCLRRLGLMQPSCR